MAPDPHFARSVSFWLRTLAFGFAIAVFSPLAEAAGWGYGPAIFALITGISAMVLAALWIVGLVLGQPWARGLIPLIVDCFWAVLWLACAAVLSKELSDYNRLSNGLHDIFTSSTGDVFSEYDTRLSVAVAFSWLAWVVGVAQIVVDVLDLSGQSASLHPSVASFTPPYVAKPTTTTIPGSIAMATAV